MKKYFVIICVICGCMMSCSQKDDPTPGGGGSGTCDGSFSIGNNKKVVFSPGNLQYQESSNTWRFAKHQYDVIGEDWVEDDTDWRDKFTWSGKYNQFGTKYVDYEILMQDTTFIDWGQLMGNEWFTLSQPEWEYMMEKRKNAAKLWGMACVNGVNCIVVLPDNINLPSSISFNYGETNPKTLSKKDIQDAIKEKNSYTLAEWNQLEALGAVLFLLDDDIDGKYWTKSINTHFSSNGLLTNANTFSATSWMGLFVSFSCSSSRDMHNFVRLVKLQK